MAVFFDDTLTLFFAISRRMAGARRSVVRGCPEAGMRFVYGVMGW